MWTCPNCSMRVRVPESSPVIRCHCGYVDYRDGRHRFASMPLSRSDWQRSHRQSICIACEHYDGHERCSEVELGCRREYLALLVDPHGECPQGKWMERRVPFVTCAHLAAAAVELADQVPPDVSRVVGIPRSGLIPAGIIASKLHLPLYTIQHWRIVPAGGGHRMQWGRYKPAGNRWLFVDDTLHNGTTLRKLREAGVPLERHVTAAVFALEPSRVDLCHSQLETPHLLEWNLFNTSYIRHLATDLDGIICHNPPHHERPKFLPRLEAAGAIISSRPETEREATVAWLAHYGVRYSTLVLWPGNEADRWDIERVAAWKAQECIQAGAEFYIESEPPLADAIRRHGLRVLCPAQGYLA